MHPLGIREVNGSILGPIHFIDKDVNSYTYRYSVRCTTKIVRIGRLPSPQTGATQFHAQLGHTSDKGRAIKEFVGSNSWPLEPYDVLNILAIDCYQQSPELKIICVMRINLINSFKCKRNLIHKSGNE